MGQKKSTKVSPFLFFKKKLIYSGITPYQAHFTSKLALH